MSEAISYVFTWHALSDACPKCQRLNGREWREQDLFQGILWDRIWGNIWDLDGDHSMAHGAYQYNCRCQLEVRVEADWSEIEDFRKFDQEVAKVLDVGPTGCVVVLTLDRY